MVPPNIKIPARTVQAEQKLILVDTRHTDNRSTYLEVFDSIFVFSTADLFVFVVFAWLMARDA